MESWREELNANELYHHGISGQRWGVRRYQNLDGSVTAAGARRYYDGVGLKGDRWGKALGERDSNGNTRYIKQTSSSGRGGGGGGGSIQSSSNEEDETEPRKDPNAQRARDQEVIDDYKARREEWIAGLRERAKNRPAKEKEEEKGKKSSSKAAGPSMTNEQFEEALRKILGGEPEEKKEEPAEEPKEEPKEEPVEEPETPEDAEDEEDVDENNLSEEEEKELGGYMVDPITEKVYRVDEETGDAYEVDPKTGKTMEGKSVNLQKGKLEKLVSAIRQGAENFREAFRNVVTSLRNAKSENEPTESTEEEPSKEEGPTNIAEPVDQRKDVASKNAEKASNPSAKSVGASIKSAVDEVNYNSARAAMTDADAAKLKAAIKAEDNETKKAELKRLLEKQMQQRLQSKR